MIADKIKVSTIACLLYLRMNSGVKKPIFVKKYTNTGNSKIMPLAKLTVVTVLINDNKLIWFATVALTWYDPKKLIDNGAII